MDILMGIATVILTVGFVYAFAIWEPRNAILNALLSVVRLGALAAFVLVILLVPPEQRAEALQTFPRWLGWVLLVSLATPVLLATWQWYRTNRLSEGD